MIKRIVPNFIQYFFSILEFINKFIDYYIFSGIILKQFLY